MLRKLGWRDWSQGEEKSSGIAMIVCFGMLGSCLGIHRVFFCSAPGVSGITSHTLSISLSLYLSLRHFGGLRLSIVCSGTARVGSGYRSAFGRNGEDLDAAFDL
jgi:hypothetical protein